MNRWRNYLFLTLCVLGLLLLPAFGQKTTGLITGVVTDPTGAVVANATVTVTNIGTGQTRTASTDTSGTYTVPDLAPGKYQVAVKTTSFKEALARDVEVHVATTTTLNVPLQMGGATETVEVTTNVVQVQTDSAVLGETIDATQVKELPLNGRNFMGLTQLAPGVSASDKGGFSTKEKGLAGGVDFAVNGNSVTNNLYLIDGANNNDVGSNRTILIYPSVDSIAEFKMLQNSYGPEYGQASGAVITMVTKSGTNAFHGDVFYAGRNDALSAWQWNAKKAAQGDPNARKGMLRRNDFGFAIGGPVIKDRIFFFYNQEWNKETRGVHYEACVPTAAEHVGDFSQDFGANGLDQCGASRPTIPAALAKGTTGSDQYIIANPTLAGQLLAARYPLPNLANPIAGTTHNWSASQNSKLPWDEINGRLDINITKNNILMGRFVRDHWNNPAKGTTGWGDDAFPALNSNWTQPSKMIVGKLTSTIGSSIVNDAEFAYSNNRIDVSVGGTGATVAGTAYTATELLQAITDAFPPIYAENLKNTHMSIPNPGWGGFDPYGAGSTGPEYGIQAPWNNKLDLYSIRDDISWVKGSHTFKAGFLFGWNGKNEDNGSPQSERPGFGARNPLNDGDTGNALANILLPGLVYNLNENSVNTRVQLRWRDYEFYGGDTWKIRKNLTLEYGIRYSLLFTPFQPNNQFTSFNPSAYNPNGAAGDPCNGLWVVGDPCGQANSTFGTDFSSGTKSPYGKYLQPQNYHLFAPRLGISWDPWGDGNWAFRAGVGQFFQRERVSSYFIYANNAPFSLNGSFDRTLSGDTPATPPKGSVSPNGGRVPTTNVPNSWQWNLSVEHSFAKDTALQIAYVGNTAIHQTNSYDINIPDPNATVSCDLTTGSYTASPWACGAFNVGSVAGTGQPVFNTYRPFSNFGTLTYWDTSGHATYHSFQTVFKTRYKRSQLTAAYTWSHSIGNVVLDDSSGSMGDQSYLYYKNTGLDRGNTNINRPHIFTANFTFFLPEMKGYNGFVRNTLGGWELSGITTAQSGHSGTAQLGGGSLPENLDLLPLNAEGKHDNNGLGAPLGLGLRNGIRPLTTGVSCNEGMTGNQIFNADAFTYVGYRIGELPTSGVASRGYCYGPHFVNTDFSLNKNFKLTERIGMQFRFDFFDLFNHPNFAGNSPGNPIKNVNCGPQDANGLYQPCSPTNNLITNETRNPGWGQEGGTIGNAGREMQYGLKITF